MKEKIWSVLSDYEGSWVAVDNGGKVVAQAGSLSEVMSASGRAIHRLTFLYAAPTAETAESR